MIVEEDSHLGALLHYVNLNPVRAGMMSVEQLKEYRWSSYWYLFNKRARPAFLDCSGALEAAGGLADTPKGRLQYLNYLKWLSTDDAAQKEMAFDKMCRGWALGTKEFKKALLEEVENDTEADHESEVVPRYDGENLREANELRWEILLDKGLAAMGQDANSILNDRKSAAWKVSLATLLKQKTSATNVWITKQLNMGTPDAVSRYVSEFRIAGGDKKTTFKELTTNVMT